MSVNHYENFPVGSILLPRRMRRPIHAIYAFARTADDIADEGDADNETRLAQLAALKAELDLIGAGQTPQTILMQRLQNEAIAPHAMPLQPFYDLLNAFCQDVVQKRYQDFGQLVDYARRSANPVGRMMLHLYGENDARSLGQSDGICTALQLINFWQDVAIDWQKQRVYLPQNDMEKFGVTEVQIAENKADFAFQRLMKYECEKAYKMLKAGAPLAKTLKGRMGWELRLIVLGGQRILQKLEENQYDVFQKRPVLTAKDWFIIIKRALQGK
ncbi:squalene synthase HpnC [Neisseriaceae bacterium B1]